MKTIYLSLLFLVFFISGCVAKTTTGSNTYKIITAEEAKSMMDKGGVIIVDVRTKEEYQEGHIKDAILIPNESIDGIAPKELGDKDAIILIYCRSGRRAKDASEKLVKLGYTNIYDFGGIIDWPYEIVD